MANITSAGTGNSNDGATWTGGSVPTSSDNAIIQNGHTVTQNAAHTFKSLRVETGGTWTADGSNHLTLSGENDSDFALQIVDGTYNHANGTVVINNGGGGIAHAAIQGGVANSTTGLYDLTISGGGTTCEIYGTTTIHRNMEAGGATTVLRGDLTVNGNLTVDGALTTIYSSTSYNLTVSGTTSVAGTLTCNASTISLGSGLTSGWGLDIQTNGTFTGGSGTHTIGSIFAASVGTKTITLSSGATTINSKNTSNGYTINLASGTIFNHGSGTVTMTYAGDTLNQLAGGTLAFNTFTYNASGRTLELRSAMSCAANLTITAGTLDTKSGTNNALTVTGWCDVDGTLTLNDSTVSINALRANSGAVITQGSSGTLELAAGGGSNFSGSGDTEGSTYNLRNLDGTSDVNLGGTTTISGGSYFEPRTAPDYASVLNNLVWNTGAYWVGNITIGGTLIVNASKHLQPYGGSKDIVVTGDVTLNGKLSAYPNGHSDLDNMTFGSLSINSGGEYAATTGTTTLTGKTSSGNYSLDNQGTFTNNSGTIKVTGDGGHIREQGTGGINNLIVELGGSSENHRLSDSTTVGGTLTIVEGDFQPNGRNLTVTGDVSIESGGTITGSSGAMSFGSLTIASGGTYSATSGTTTITNQTGGGYGWYNVSGGTFTHNNGLVKFTDNASVYCQENTFYDLELNLSSVSLEFRWSDISGNTLNILNDFTISSGRFKFNTAGDNIIVHGLTKLESTSQFGLNSPSGTHTFNGLVKLNGGTWFLSSGTNNMAGIRNVGGTIS
jgi:hypothetical protein